MRDPRDSGGSLEPWVLRGSVLILLLALGWSIGASLRAPKANAWAPVQRKLRVRTTSLPLYNLARTMGGPDVEVRNLLPPGVDPHEFALSPHDIALVDQADLLVMNGAGLDDFLMSAVRKARPRDNRRIVVASAGIPRLNAGSHEGDEGAHGESGDPHMWLDPVFARRYTKVIAAEMEGELRDRDEGQAATRVARRATALEDELARLDEDYRRTLAPLQGRGFIAFHGAFAYLAARYNLRIAGVWQTTPGREPGPRDVAALLRMARDRGVRALLSEPQFSPRALEMIAHDARIPVYTIDPFETAPNLDSADYIVAMRANLQTLVRALGGKPSPSNAGMEARTQDRRGE
jgi:zinc transport system substrate-binding protein